MVDVMDTLQQVISIIEKEIAKNLTFLQKEIDTRNTNNHGSAHQKEDLNVNSLQQTVLIVDEMSIPVTPTPTVT